MPLKIVSWNINSVRLRMPLIEDLIEQHQPDIICLQEIKCAEDQFPAKPLKNNGYDHFAVSGQKGYHGVATISKYPIVSQDKMGFCPKDEARHIHAKIEGFPSKLHKSISIHNFYVPAGGDIPDFEKNPKFAHKFEHQKKMMSGHTNKCSKLSLTHRKRSRLLKKSKWQMTGLMRCVNTSLMKKNFFHGGATAQKIGKAQIEVDVSIISG